MDQDASLLNNHMARCRCSRSHFTRVGMPIIFMMIIILVVGDIIMPLVSQRYNDGRNVGVNEEGRDCCWNESDNGTECSSKSSKGGSIFARILFFREYYSTRGLWRMIPLRTSRMNPMLGYMTLTVMTAKGII